MLCRGDSLLPPGGRVRHAAWRAKDRGTVLEAGELLLARQDSRPEGAVRKRRDGRSVAVAVDYLELAQLEVFPGGDGSRGDGSRGDGESAGNAAAQHGGPLAAG